MTNSIKIFLVVSGILLLGSCSYMFDSIFHGEKCQTCLMVDSSGTTESTFEECGGYYSQAEEDCKLAAYDKNEFLNRFEYSCDCTSEKREE